MRIDYSWIRTTKFLRPLSLLLASSLSGLLLFLAFPTYEQWWLGWVGLVPLLVSVSGRRPVHGFLLSYSCGLVFVPGIFSWVLEIQAYRYTHHLILVSYLGAYFGLFGLIYSFLARRRGTAFALLFAPFIWVSMEYIRSSIPLLALPWGLLGHSQYRHLPIIQFASFTGAYGVSFLMVLVNATCSALMMRLLSLTKAAGRPIVGRPTVKGALSISIATAVLTGLALLYGTVTLSRPPSGKAMKASLVQGNIEQSKKWDPEYADMVMQTYIDLSEEASRDRPALIIWPEAATPGPIMKDPSRWEQMTSLANRTGAHYLIGSTDSPKFQEAARRSGKKYGNTALFISPEGRLLNQYLKIRLVPFAEYIPYEGHIKWPRFIVPEEGRGTLVEGDEHTVFALGEKRLSVAICWETIFPGLVRGFAQKGANILINITNEAWFGESAYPYQSLAITVFRAVENRASLARAGNTGISCIIDPCGRVIGKVCSDGRDTFVRGYVTGDVPISREKTLYTVYGDMFIYLCLLATTLAFCLSLMHRKPT